MLGQRCQAGSSPGEGPCSAGLLLPANECSNLPEEMHAAARALLMMFANPGKEKLKISLFKRALAVQRGLTLENAVFE